MGRFGVKTTGKESQEDLFKDVLRAERTMAEKTRPELWKTTAKAFGVEDLVDINRMWSFKTQGTTAKKLEDDLKEADRLAKAAALPKPEDAAAKAAAAKAGETVILTKSIMQELGGWLAEAFVNKTLDDFNKNLRKIKEDPGSLKPHLMTPDECEGEG